MMITRSDPVWTAFCWPHLFPCLIILFGVGAAASPLTVEWYSCSGTTYGVVLDGPGLTLRAVLPLDEAPDAPPRNHRFRFEHRLTVTDRGEIKVGLWLLDVRNPDRAVGVPMPRMASMGMFCAIGPSPDSDIWQCPDIRVAVQHRLYFMGAPVRGPGPDAVPSPEIDDEEQGEHDTGREMEVAEVVKEMQIEEEEAQNEERRIKEVKKNVIEETTSMEFLEMSKIRTQIGTMEMLPNIDIKTNKNIEKTVLEEMMKLNKVDIRDDIDNGNDHDDCDKEIEGIDETDIRERDAHKTVSHTEQATSPSSDDPGSRTTAMRTSEPGGNALRLIAHHEIESSLSENPIKNRPEPLSTNPIEMTMQKTTITTSSLVETLSIKEAEAAAVSSCSSDSWSSPMASVTATSARCSDQDGSSSSITPREEIDIPSDSAIHIDHHRVVSIRQTITDPTPIATDLYQTSGCCCNSPSSTSTCCMEKVKELHAFIIQHLKDSSLNLGTTLESILQHAHDQVRRAKPSKKQNLFEQSLVDPLTDLVLRDVHHQFDRLAQYDHTALPVESIDRGLGDLKSGLLEEIVADRFRRLRSLFGQCSVARFGWAMAAFKAALSKSSALVHSRLQTQIDHLRQALILNSTISRMDGPRSSDDSMQDPDRHSDSIRDGNHLLIEDETSLSDPTIDVALSEQRLVDDMAAAFEQKIENDHHVDHVPLREKHALHSPATDPIPTRGVSVHDQDCLEINVCAQDQAASDHVHHSDENVPVCEGLMLVNVPLSLLHQITSEDVPLSTDAAPVASDAVSDAAPDSVEAAPVSYDAVTSPGSPSTTVFVDDDTIATADDQSVSSRKAPARTSKRRKKRHNKDGGGRTGPAAEPSPTAPPVVACDVYPFDLKLHDLLLGDSLDNAVAIPVILDEIGQHIPPDPTGDLVSHGEQAQLLQDVIDSLLPSTLSACGDRLWAIESLSPLFYHTLSNPQLNNHYWKSLVLIVAGAFKGIRQIVLDKLILTAALRLAPARAGILPLPEAQGLEMTSSSPAAQIDILLDEIRAVSRTALAPMLSRAFQTVPESDLFRALVQVVLENELVRQNTSDWVRDLVRGQPGSVLPPIYTCRELQLPSDIVRGITSAVLNPEDLALLLQCNDRDREAIGWARRLMTAGISASATKQYRKSIRVALRHASEDDVVKALMQATQNHASSHAALIERAQLTYGGNTSEMMLKVLKTYVKSALQRFAIKELDGSADPVQFVDGIMGFAEAFALQRELAMEELWHNLLDVLLPETMTKQFAAMAAASGSVLAFDDVVRVLNATRATCNDLRISPFRDVPNRRSLRGAFLILIATNLPLRFQVLLGPWHRPFLLMVPNSATSALPPQ